MVEVAQLKIAAKLAIHAGQKIQVKSCRHTDRIIVSSELERNILLQIGTEQQRIARLQRRSYLPEEILRRWPVKISDRAPQEQNANVLAGFAAGGHGPQTLQVRFFVTDQTDEVHLAKLFFASRKRGG